MQLIHGEDDGGATSLAYITGHDTAQGTGAQIIAEGISNDADHGVSRYFTSYMLHQVQLLLNILCVDHMSYKNIVI